MKTKTVLTVLAAFLIVAVSDGCKGKSNTEKNNDDISDGMKTMTIDNVSAVWIQDNEGLHLMKPELFADATGEMLDSLGLQNGVPSSMSAFLIESNGIKILFDTGLGAPDSRLLKSLKDAGLSPEDIKYIYLTHFHGDHIGGMLRNDSVVFPNAGIYASRLEYEAWMNMPAEKNALAVKTMNAYKENLHLFEFGDTLPGNVVTIDAVGHTPGHTAFQAGKFLVTGDLVHGAALQLKYPEICASYDMVKEQAVKTRIRLLRYAKENNLTMAGMHMPAPGFAQSSRLY